MPKIVDREKKQESLIQAAACVFATRGFANTRMADIADHAEVGKGTVYEYFEGKEELYFAVFEWINQKISERIEGSLKRGGSAREQLAAVIGESATVVTEMRDIYSLNLDFWASCRGSAHEGRFKASIDGLYREYRGLMTDLITRGQAEGDFRADVDARALAAGVVGAFDGLGIQYWIDDSLDLGALTNVFAQVIFAGLKPRDANPRATATVVDP